VLDIVQAACVGLLEEVRGRLVQASDRREETGGSPEHVRPRDPESA
jgi:hypothetical protein